MRVVAGVCALVVVAGCGGGGSSPSKRTATHGRPPALRVLTRVPAPSPGLLLGADDLGEMRARCRASGPAQLFYVDRAGTGIDLRVRVGDGPEAHQLPGEGRAVSMLVPQIGRTPGGRARFADVHLVALSTREPEEIRARIDLSLEAGFPGLHASGCDLRQARVRLATLSHAG